MGKESSMTLADAKPGDVVQYHAGTVVMFGVIAGAGWVRWVDEVTHREISEPHMLPLDTPCTLVRRGVERWPKQRGDGAEVDPLRRAS